MSDTEAELRKKIADLERELSVRRVTGEATNSLLSNVRRAVVAAQLEGTVHALRTAVRDYTPDQGTWEEFLTRRADSLQKKRDGMDPLNA